MNMIFDLGASCNIINRQLSEQLKKNRSAVNVILPKKNCSCGDREPLLLAVAFTTEVSNKTKSEVEFIVIEEKDEELLEKDMATKLRILIINPKTSMTI